MPHIKLSAMRIRQSAEANGVAFDGPADREAYRRWDAYDLWQTIDGLIAYDACTVVARFDRADEAEASLRAAGHEVTNRRPIYWCNGPQGFVLHEIHEE